jgi:predicted Zn finger-like uncharacterized protein
MYTQCPECQIAFRVSAKILQQAAGNVRCGSCSHAFNALHYLSEDMPEPTSADSNETPNTEISDDDLAETSRRLLQTLDELAGPEEVRIEDTGVEWRVLDEAMADSDGPVLVDTGQSERRYDDNTPLPDEFDDDAEGYTPPLVPQRRTEDFDNPGGEFEDRQGDLALSEPEDWTELLLEVRSPDPESFDIEEELAAIHTDLSTRDEMSESLPADLDTQFDTQAEAMGLDITNPEDELTDEVPHLGESDVDLMEAESEFESKDEDVVEADDDDIDDIESWGADEEDLELTDEDDTGVFEIDDVSAKEVDEGAGNDTDAEIDVDENEGDDGADNLGWESTGAFEEQIDIAARELSGELSADEEAGDTDAEFEDETEDETHVLNPDDEEEDETHVLNLDDEEEDETEDESHVLNLDDEEVATAPVHEVPEPTEEEMTVNMEIDEELMAAAEKDSDFTATLVGLKTPEQLFDENSDEVETIIMEGEFVRSVVEKERLAAENAARSQLDDPVRLADTYATSRDKLRGGRRRYDPPAPRLMIAAAVLAIALVGQYIHNSRESLATYGFFNQTIAPLYRVLGQPVTPEWDIKGWQFEATNGSVGAEETNLTIVSRIGNKAEEALPYPLIHVSLTNRFEDIMGSRILEPGEYLAGDLDPSSPVMPGDNFTAVITIEEPSADATGFKLNVCYRVRPGTVRCAIEDFKN